MVLMRPLAGRPQQQQSWSCVVRAGSASAVPPAAPTATQPAARCLALMPLRPFLLCTNAVSVDGQVAKTYRPREKDPEGGWWTEAANAPPDAPFNQPFYLIL